MGSTEDALDMLDDFEDALIADLGDPLGDLGDNDVDGLGDLLSLDPSDIDADDPDADMSDGKNNSSAAATATDADSYKRTSSLNSNGSGDHQSHPAGQNTGESSETPKGHQQRQGAASLPKPPSQETLEGGSGGPASSSSGSVQEAQAAQIRALQRQVQRAQSGRGRGSGSGNGGSSTGRNRRGGRTGRTGGGMSSATTAQLRAVQAQLRKEMPQHRWVSSAGFNGAGDDVSGRGGGSSGGGGADWQSDSHLKYRRAMVKVV
jgi:hypothetical protein